MFRILAGGSKDGEGFTQDARFNSPEIEYTGKSLQIDQRQRREKFAGRCAVHDECSDSTDDEE